MTNDYESKNLGKMLKQRRVMLLLTLQKLGDTSGVSPSHLGRIERGGRVPSALILRRIAKPLDSEEGELLSLAGYLSPRSVSTTEGAPLYRSGQLDPYVSMMLAQEPPEVQHAVIGILSILKNLARAQNEATTLDGRLRELITCPSGEGKSSHD